MLILSAKEIKLKIYPQEGVFQCTFNALRSPFRKNRQFFSQDISGTVGASLWRSRAREIALQTLHLTTLHKAKEHKWELRSRHLFQTVNCSIQKKETKINFCICAEEISYRSANFRILSLSFCSFYVFLSISTCKYPRVSFRAI